MATTCKFCGQKLKRRQAAYSEAAGTVGTALGGILIVLEMAGFLERNGLEEGELRRMAWNGARIAKAMHQAAHGDHILATTIGPQVNNWLELAVDLTKTAANESRAEYEAAAERLGGYEAAGAKARWMTDNVAWDEITGDLILPEGGV